MSSPESQDERAVKSSILDRLRSTSKLLTQNLPLGIVGENRLRLIGSLFGYTVGKAIQGQHVPLVELLHLPVLSQGAYPDFVDSMYRPLEQMGIHLNRDILRYQTADFFAASAFCSVMLSNIMAECGEENPGKKKTAAALIIGIGLAAWEMHQAHTPGRSFDWPDTAAYAAGIALFMGSDGIGYCYSAIRDKYGGDINAFVTANRERIGACVNEIKNDQRFKAIRREIESSLAYSSQGQGFNGYQ